MTKTTEPESHQLLVQRIELAHRWNMNQFATEQNNVSLKRALRRDQLNNEGRNHHVTGIQIIEPILERI
jgi:hypothetical protein